jgi:hypothetical protein
MEKTYPLIDASLTKDMLVEIASLQKRGWIIECVNVWTDNAGTQYASIEFVKKS